MPLISVRNVTKTYRLGEVAVRALAGVTLDMDAGELVAISGPSGSGKSTFMHVLGCLDRPTTGDYLLSDRNVARLSDDVLSEIRNRQIGFVFQSFNLIPRTSALENVELPLLYNGTRLTAAARRDRARTALAAVALDHRADHEPSQLSGGEQQRVAIARALINNPTILLADEPTGNLDTRTSIEIMNIFQRLNADDGILVVLITHEQAIAEYASRLIGFRDGLLVSDQPNPARRVASEELCNSQPAAGSR
jgi:putative ABC transport system ATP-binding protein